MRRDQVVSEASAVAAEAWQAAPGGAEPPEGRELLYLACWPWTLAVGFALLALRAFWREIEEGGRPQ